MTTLAKCSRCGADLAAGSPGGHCLNCLLLLGIEPGPEPEPEAQAPGPAPVRADDPNPADLPLADLSGQSIGPYKLLRQIGEGGCGVVYLAEQLQPIRRRVAFKVVKLGMDTRQVIARFAGERQALALMDHPHVARVLDAGATPSGRPFFVMELVDGLKITDYCDRHQLPLAQRLELFIQVCRAVQHAHQKGIIHRDLKPSNILVAEQDGKPAPKVIDFGIAKATTDLEGTNHSLYTAWEQFIGTPAYMSPEQAGRGGADVDTRSDIYSLGVLLYELLTGLTPFDAAQLKRQGLDQTLRTIRELEPARPSTRLGGLSETQLTTAARHRQSDPAPLLRRLRGDLDWIVMKALEKDRSRRYATANGLAQDVMRHLANEPVVARPPAALYLLQKTVRRHKLAFAAGTFVFLALAIGGGAAGWWLREARRAQVAAQSARREAERQGDLAAKREAASQALLDFMLKKLVTAAQPLIENGGLGPDVTLRAALESAERDVSSAFAAQPALELSLRCSLGWTFYHLGVFTNAIQQFERGITLARSPGISNIPICLDLMSGECGSLSRLKRCEDCVRTARQAADLAAQVYGPTDEHSINALVELGLAYRYATNYPECVRVFERAHNLACDAWGGQDLRSLEVLNHLGYTYSVVGEPARAVSTLQMILAAREAAFGPEREETTRAKSDLGRALVALGQVEKGLAMMNETYEIRRRVHGPDHRLTWLAASALTSACLGAGRIPDAAEWMAECYRIDLATLGPGHAQTRTSLTNLAELRQKLGSPPPGAPSQTATAGPAAPVPPE